MGGFHRMTAEHNRMQIQSVIFENRLQKVGMLHRASPLVVVFFVHFILLNKIPILNTVLTLHGISYVLRKILGIECSMIR